MRKSVPFTHPSASGQSSIWSTLGPVFGFGSTLFILGLISYWGGVAMSGPLFVAGIIVLSAMVAGAGFAAWWLFLSPLPGGRVIAPARSTELRQYVALTAVVGGIIMVTGGVWDEQWHRTYGLGRVLNDFFWRPHLMIYGSMGISSLFAGGAMLLVLRGKGGIRERFRSEPLIGLLGVASAYLALSGPSDLIWHRLYGRELSGWSLPHLLLIGGFAFVMLLAMSILLSLMPRREWRRLGQLHIYEVLSILLMALAMSIMMIIMVSSWEGLTSIDQRTERRIFWTWPEWLYPVVVVTNGVVSSMIAIHALRRAGVATLLALSILAVRLILFAGLGIWTSTERMGFDAQLLLLPPAIALDVWYALRLRQPDSAATLVGGGLVAGVVFLAVALPAIPLLMVYPRVNETTVPGMIFFTMIMAVWSAWVGARTGAWFGGLDRQISEVAPLRGRPAWIGAATLVGLLTFTVLFIATATPPV
jgi:hypothetical protein